MPLKMPNIDTRVGRNTKALITSVAERRDGHPDTMAYVDYINIELASTIQFS